MSCALFARRLFAHRTRLHAIAPSSRTLARVLVAGLELDPELSVHLRGRHPRLAFVRGDAAELSRGLADRELPRAAAVISGLPLAAMSEELQDRILDGVSASLRPGGVFRQFRDQHDQLATSARRLRQLLAGRVATSAVRTRTARELPPALTLEARTTP